MANYYVDSNSGDDEDNGTTQALAWATLENALEVESLAAGDIVWVRRTHVEYSGSPTSDLYPAAIGEVGNYVRIIGWPRAALPDTTITSASWTNGSTTVDLVVGVTLSRTEHCGRWATAPNGSKFLITRIIDSNTLIIDREYSGTGVSAANGKFQIEAYEDFSGKPADIDGWDSDADDLPVLDFNGTAYKLNLSRTYAEMCNFEVINSISTTGVVYLANNSKIVGFLISSTYNWYVLYSNGNSCIDRTVVTGNATGSSQAGFRGEGILTNLAIYNMGGYGIHYTGPAVLNNVNVGVEQVNAQADIYGADIIRGVDVKLGSTTKIEFGGVNTEDLEGVKIENYQKVLGDHVSVYNNIMVISKGVVAGSGDPYSL